MGWGIIRSQGNHRQYVAHGVIKAGTGAFPERLGKIFSELDTVIQTYAPVQVGIEDVFMARNADSALKLGQARGAAIACAMNRGVEVFEYSARQVKQSVVGRGAADKQQVQQMVNLLLSTQMDFPVDASDALAVALCHANTSGTLSRIGVQSSNYRMRQLMTDGK